MKALVTGGTSGLGQGVAQQLAQTGWDVVIVGRNPIRGEQIATQIGGTFAEADLSLLAETACLADRLTGPFDAVILCAGAIFPDDQPLTEEGLDPTFALNYLSRFALSQALLPKMTDNGRFIIVSGNGKHKNTPTDWAAPHTGQTAAFKAALAVDLYASELARRVERIQVYTCYPGWVRTNLLQNAPLPTRLIFQLFGSPIEKGSAHLVRLTSETSAQVHWHKSKPMQFSPSLSTGDIIDSLWAYSEKIVAEKTAVHT